MYVAMRRYTVTRPEAADEFVRRVIAEPAAASAAATPPTE